MPDPDKAAGNRGGLVGDARSYFISAAGLLRFARPVMERTARDRSAANDLGGLPHPGP